MNEQDGYGTVSFASGPPEEIPDAVSTTATIEPVVADTAAPAVPDSEPVTCPECGTAAHVVFNHRDARDFCRTCDYPLFWTPSVVQRDRSGADESLRRLPGTLGRATIASLPCPHCAEPNALSAQVCVRCGAPMHPEPATAPAPVPVYVAPPPAPEPEPERGWPWWAWLLLALGIAAALTVLILYGTGVIG
jgi:hypothetical protein